MNDINYINAVNSYNKLAQSNQTAPGMEPRDNPSVDFGNMVEGAIKSAVEAQKTSEAVAADAVLGKADLVDVMQAVNNAEASLNMFIAVRDRVIQSYEQILRMPI